MITNKVKLNRLMRLNNLIVKINCFRKYNDYLSRMNNVFYLKLLKKADNLAFLINKSDCRIKKYLR